MVRNVNEIFTDKLRRAKSYYPGTEQLEWLLNNNLSTEYADILYSFIKYCYKHDMREQSYCKRAIDAVLRFENR